MKDELLKKSGIKPDKCQQCGAETNQLVYKKTYADVHYWLCDDCNDNLFFDFAEDKQNKIP